jgi:hypothetical protein
MLGQGVGDWGEGGAAKDSCTFLVLFISMAITTNCQKPCKTYQYEKASQRLIHHAKLINFTEAAVGMMPFPPG